MNAPPHRFPLMDALRAIAALSVLGYHIGGNGVLSAYPDNPLRPLFAHLDVGVPIFFLISGFLLYGPFAAARLERRPPPDANAYGWRRIMRIVPAYWFALAFSALVLGTAGVLSVKGVPAYFGFLQIYNPDTARGGLDSTWSLCVEISFYAFLPLWAYALRRLVPRGGLRSELVGLGALYVASVVFQAFAVSRTDVNLRGAGAAPWLDPLPNHLDQFAVGMALAVVVAAARRSGPLQDAVTALARRSVLGWALAAGAFALLGTQIGLAGERGVLTGAEHLARHQLDTVVALGVLVPAIFAVPGRGFGGRLLGARPLLWLGTISYGVFLWHVPVFEALWGWGLGPGGGWELAAWVLVGFAATLALSTFSLHVIERPAMALGARRAARAAASTGPSLPAVQRGVAT